VTKRLTSKIGNPQKKSAKNLHVASPYSRVTYSRPSPPKSENRKKSAKNLHVASPYTRVARVSPPESEIRKNNLRKTFMLPHPTQDPHHQNQNSSEIIPEKTSCCPLTTRVTRPLPPESEIRRNNPRKIFMLPTHYKNDKTPTSRITDPQKKSSKNLHVASLISRMTRISPPN
jgi:hypothetical protein